MTLQSADTSNATEITGPNYQVKGQLASQPGIPAEYFFASGHTKSLMGYW